MESSSSKPAEIPVHRIYINPEILPQDDGTVLVYQSELGDLHSVFGIMDFEKDIPIPKGYREIKAIIVKTKKRARTIFLPAP